MKKGFLLFFLLFAIGGLGAYLLITSGAGTWRALVSPVCFIAFGAIAVKYKIWEV